MGFDKKSPDATLADGTQVHVDYVGSHDDEANAVPAKYRGTANDKHDMSVLGRKQVLRVRLPDSRRAQLTTEQRNFRFITMLGFASTAMASWEVLLP